MFYLHAGLLLSVKHNNGRNMLEWKIHFKVFYIYSIHEEINSSSKRDELDLYIYSISRDLLNTNELDQSTEK